MDAARPDSSEDVPDRIVERRIVSVLFADLVGFTTLSERLDAEDVAAVQDAYFELVRDTVARHGGQVEKFIGDAAMAVFGLTRARDDDAERAVRAGLALVAGVEALGGRLGLEVGDLELRVGINSGEVVTAEAGPDRGRVTGDVVNTAARLQSAAPPGRVLVGELTALAVAEAIEVGPAEPLALKGKAEPVRAGVVTAVRPERSRDDAMGGLRAPLLGRDGELEELRRIADVAAGGRCERILLVAPPGVGKTRLLEAVAGSLAGFHVLRARIRPEAGSPFEAVVQLLRSAFGDPAARQLHQEHVARLLAHGLATARAEAIAGDDAVATPDRLGGASAEPAPAMDRAGAFEAWAAALDTAANGPSAWLIEDLHWAGPDLLAFLDAVQARPRAAGRLILATARPSLLERVDAAGASAESGPTARPDAWSVLDLPALGAIAASTLIEALVGPALPPELVDRIVARSDGNPLFIEELLRTWIAAGTLAAGDAPGAWLLAVPVGEAPLPATVQGIYAGQLDDLPAGARSAARRASVAGRRFPAAALPSLGVDDAADALATLRRRALISGPRPVPLTGEAYAYRHALLQDAAYASLARAERARLHVRLARWLEETAGRHAGELADTIAGHYEAAVTSAPALASEIGGGLDRPAAMARAADWLERAGERALGQFAHAAAVSAFERAIRMTAGGDRSADARRRERLGRATVRAGDLDEAAGLFAEAAAGFRAVLDDPRATPDDRTTARRGLAGAAAAEAETRYEQIRFAECLAIADRALSVVGTDDPLASVPLLLARLHGREGLTNDWPTLAAEAAEVLAIAVASGDPALIFVARQAALGFGHSAGTTTPDAWLAFATEARGLGRWEEAAGATLNAAGLVFDSDRPRVRALLDEAERMAQAKGLTAELAWCGQFRSEIGLVDGDWLEARRVAVATLDLADAHRLHRAAVRTWFALAAIAEPMGDRDLLAQAARWFEDHRGIFPDSPYGLLHRTAVDLRLAAFGLGGQPGLDDPALLAAFEVPESAPSWLAAVERVVEAQLERGLLGPAGDAIDRYWAAGAAADHARWLVRGWLARAHGDPRGAADAFSRAAAAARAAHVPWWLARALRGLEAVGRANPADVEEAGAIEERLGVTPRPWRVPGRDRTD